MMRRVLLVWCLLFSLLLLAGGLLLQHQTAIARDIRIEEQTVTLPQWSEETPSVRVAVVADAHVAFWEGRKLDTIVNTVTDLHPDLILMLGDFPYGVCNALSLPEAVCYAKLRPLADAAPVLYIIGNHDNYYRRMRQEFARLGFLCCDNATRRIWLSPATALDIAGFTWSYGPPLKPYLPRNAAAADTDTVPLLALAHYPESFYRHPLPEATLALAAHTHGGQICRADGEPLLAPRTLTREEARGGRHSRADGGLLYITRGIGLSRLPLRINCPAEITLLVLRGSAQEE